MTTLILGIAGGTGGGKTTLARILCQRYASVAVIDEDSYYVDRSHLSPDERAGVNYDDPSAFDHETLITHLVRLRHGEPICKPRYCFVTHTRTAETDVVRPDPLVIVEGLLTLWEPRVRRLLDLKVFVDADAEVRFIRRLERDVSERGRDMQSVIQQYLGSVRPMHAKFVEPTKRHADLVISGENLLAEVPRLVARIDARLASTAGAEHRRMTRV